MPLSAPAKPSNKTTLVLLPRFGAAGTHRLSCCAVGAEIAAASAPSLIFLLDPGQGKACIVDSTCGKPAAYTVISPPSQRDEAGRISSCSVCAVHGGLCRTGCGAGGMLDAPPPTCDAGSQRKGFARCIGNVHPSPAPARQESSTELAGKRVPLENNIQPRLEEDALHRARRNVPPRV